MIVDSIDQRAIKIKKHGWAERCVAARCALFARVTVVPVPVGIHGPRLTASF